MPNDDAVCEELVRLLRLQRHDFINHMQVIYALLQLGKGEKAMKYIEDVTKDAALLAEPLALHRQQANCLKKAQS